MLTELELKCLWAIADDYEEIPQIRLDLKNHARTDASPSDISISLHKLTISKLAQAYEYDESKGDYVEIEFPYEKTLLPSAAHTWRPGENTTTRLWFYITQAGKDYLKGQSSPCSEC
jgi:hypothetical protein